MVRNISSILKAACAGVRESASCIVAQRIPDSGSCHHNQFDYRLLFVKRHQKMKSWPGVMTFPGGAIDKADSENVRSFTQLKTIDKLAASKPSDIENEYRITALRELIEETEFPYNIDIKTFIPWSIWQTPLSFSRRFNTAFYVIFAGSEELNLKPREGEIESIHWLSPAEILRDSSMSIAPPTIADLWKFYPHNTFDQLVKFARHRYQNYATNQCMPVLAKLQDGMIGIYSADSFYFDALELQLKDRSQIINIGSTIEAHNAKQKVLCRSKIPSQDGHKSCVVSNTLWDGHNMSGDSLNFTFSNIVKEE